MNMDIGTKVKLSKQGRTCHEKQNWHREGIVTGLCKQHHLRRVLWEGLKHIQYMHLNFLREVKK